MPVKFSCNLMAGPMLRLEMEKAFTEVLGELPGEWVARMYCKGEPSDWLIDVTFPDGVKWERKFKSPDETNPESVKTAIRQALKDHH